MIRKLHLHKWDCKQRIVAVDIADAQSQRVVAAEQLHRVLKIVRRDIVVGKHQSRQAARVQRLLKVGVSDDDQLQLLGSQSGPVAVVFTEPNNCAALHALGDAHAAGAKFLGTRRCFGIQANEIGLCEIEISALPGAFRLELW